MDGRTDIRSCEYRAKILDLEFATCIEEKNNDYYSKCSSNHFHYSAHFARSSSSPIPISDFRFAGIAVIFCWSRTCANIPKTKNSIFCWNRIFANIPKDQISIFLLKQNLCKHSKDQNQYFLLKHDFCKHPKDKKNNNKVLQTKQQQHYQHQQKSIKTKLTVSVSRPLMASSIVASIHSSLSVTFATSVLVWIC